MPIFPCRTAEIGLPGPVIGVDEVGRGPICSSVVAGAIIIPGHVDEIPDALKEVRDSKAMSPKRREALDKVIKATCLWGIGESTAAEIDEIGILPATFQAMRRALEAVKTSPGHALVDGNLVPPGFPCPVTTIIKGDQKCLSIAAASIIAKVYRDKMMVELDTQYPGYGWARNAGYPTPEHKAAIARLGPTPHHRRSFSW